MQDLTQNSNDRLRIARIHEQMYLEFNQKIKIQPKLRT